MKRSSSCSCFAIIVLAGVVRVFYNITAAKGYYPSHDSAEYQDIALNLLHNHCYCLLPQTPTVTRAPLWPIIIASIYSILGPHDHFVRLFLCVMGAGTCALLYFFMRDMFGRRIAILGGCLAAVYPFLFIYDSWLYSESLYTFLLFAFCYTLYRLQHNPKIRITLLGGVLLGTLALTRPNGLVIFGAFIFWALVMGYTRFLSWRIVARTIFITSLLLTAIVLPWTIRNYLVTQRLVFVATGDGTVLLGAYNDKVVGTWYENGHYQGIWVAPQEAVPEVTKLFPSDCGGSCEVERDNIYRYYAWKWIWSHTKVVPSLLIQHVLNLWQVTSKEADLSINVYPDRTISHSITTMMEVITPIVFALAAFGLFVTRKHWRELLFLYIVILITLGESTFFYGISRFRAPLEPIFILLGAGVIQWLIQPIVLLVRNSSH